MAGVPGFQKFSDIDHACAAAIQNIREIVRQATLAGREMEIDSVDIIDERGKLLLSILASDVVEAPEQYRF